MSDLGSFGLRDDGEEVPDERVDVLVDEHRECDERRGIAQWTSGDVVVVVAWLAGRR